MSVAFVREESAEAAQEVSLPPRAISPHPESCDSIRAPCGGAGPR